jgi:excisionase family DNA binding protein
VLTVGSGRGSTTPGTVDHVSADAGPTAVEELNLKQVAARLGVHYMTAYRYVRTGRLPATKVGAGWVVALDDLESFTALEPEVDTTSVDWRSRLRDQLLLGDETEAWRVIERALASGHTAQECYVDLLGGAIAEIGEASPDGVSEVDDPVGPFLATATATRLVARLGARFRRPGRNRGTVVFGAPAGERHDLPIAIVADLVRLEGFTCLELGSDVPAAAFAAAARRSERLVAVGIGVTRVENLDAVAASVAAVRAVAPDVPVIVGGLGVRNPEVAATVGATAWAPSGAGAVALVAQLAGARR